MFSIMLTSEVCWCVLSITIVYLSLYFLASNPLIILTDPSPAKIQNQHTTVLTILTILGWTVTTSKQSYYSQSLHSRLSPGWSQSLAVMHSVAAPVSWGDPGLMEPSPAQTEIVPRPCSASFIFCPNIPLITTTSTSVFRDRT